VTGLQLIGVYARARTRTHLRSKMEAASSGVTRPHGTPRAAPPTAFSAPVVKVCCGRKRWTGLPVAPTRSEKDRRSAQPVLVGGCVGRIDWIDARAGSGRDREFRTEN
jgi:hypothetical protein